MGLRRERRNEEIISSSVVGWRIPDPGGSWSGRVDAHYV